MGKVPILLWESRTRASLNFREQDIDGDAKRVISNVCVDQWVELRACHKFS